MISKRYSSWFIYTPVLILSGLVFASFAGCHSRNTHAETMARAQLAQIEALIDEWELKHSHLPPTTVDGLKVLGDLVPNPQGISSLLLTDPWRHKVVYRVPSSRSECRYDLYSIGPNGIDDHGYEDDIIVDDLGHRPGCPR